jgi:hypothetical protein
MCFISSSLISLVVSNSLNVVMNVSATETNAASGHGRNQSMVHSLKSAGNFLDLSLNFYPTGEKHNTMCRLSLILSTK